MKLFKETLIKIWKNLTKIWNFSFKWFSFSQLKKLYYRVKTFHYKIREIWGNGLHWKNFLQNLEGAAFPLPPGSWPHESYYQVSAFRAVARLATVRGKEGAIENFLILRNICKNLKNFEWIFKNIWENLKKNLKNSKRFLRKNSQKKYLKIFEIFQIFWKGFKKNFLKVKIIWKQFI